MKDPPLEEKMTSDGVVLTHEVFISLLLKGVILNTAGILNK